jgi:hypothetical protein
LLYLCFVGTKVQKLTQKGRGAAEHGRQVTREEGAGEGGEGSEGPIDFILHVGDMSYARGYTADVFSGVPRADI